MVLEYDSLLEFGLIRITADEKRERVKKLFVDVQKKLGKWILGQITVSTIAGIVGLIILSIVKVPFALPLAVFIALLDAVPNVGATIGLIPAIIVALITVGPVGTIIIIIVSIVYQQIENNFIVPKIMGNAVGIKPVIVMLGVVSALLLFGIFGALVAVPVMVLVKIVYEFYIDLQKLKAKGIV
jgi:predicted PurR-regulated permease PerM